MDPTDISESSVDDTDNKAESPPAERTSVWQGDSGGWSWGSILAGLFCIIGAVITAATIAILVPIDEVPDDGGGHTNSSGPSGMPATDLTGATDRPTSMPKMTRKATTNLTGVNYRVTSVPKTTTKATTTPEPPGDAPAYPHDKLLCTTNTKIGQYTILPDDGVCDYLFYDSLSNGDLLRLAEVLEKKLPPIIDYAKNAVVTELGISLSGVDRTLQTTLTSQFVNDYFHVLWQDKIYHFGMLNVHSPDATWENIRRCLATLKVIYKATIRRFFGSRKIYTVLGMAPQYPFDSRIADSLDETPPSLVIFLTHVSFEDRRQEDCRILPTSMTKFPENIPRSAFKYGLSIFEVMSYISDMQNRGINWTAAISFTMRGHFYKPKSISETGESFFQPFQPCEDFFGPADLEPHLLCKDYNSSFGYKMDKRNVFAFNVAWNKMMMFDNDYALTGKLCAARIAYPQVRFGIAAYDVIYDQGHTCPKFQLVGSPFGRVQTLGLVRRRTKDFYDSQDMQSCLGLFGSKAEWKEANASTWPDGETGVTDHYDFDDYDFSMLQRAPLERTSSGTTSGE